MKLVLSKFEIDRALQSMVTQWETFCNEHSLNVDNSIFVPVLKGGVYTGIKLVELIINTLHVDVQLGFMGLSSYKNKLTSTQTIDETYPLDLDSKLLKGKHIWIVDDIFDSGQTLRVATGIIKRIQELNNVPIHVYSAVLVKKVKPGILYQSYQPNIVGFELSEDKFLVGVGMGLGEKYRCLNELYELEEKDIKTER